MKLIRPFVFLFLLSIMACSTTKLPSEEKMNYLHKTFQGTDIALPYRIMYPEKKLKKYPLIIFLHGSGERGTDNEKQLVHGSKWMQENMVMYPAIAVFPQCPTNDYWSNVTVTTNADGKRKFTFTDNAKTTPAMKALMELINDLSSKSYIDQSRIYVMGLSMGGMATFELMWRMPGKFAAGAPICGGGVTSQAANIAKTKAIWIFHGIQDDVVPIKNSRDMHEAIRQYSPQVKLTEYDGVAHNSWDNVFLEPNFFKWLFEKKK